MQYYVDYPKARQWHKAQKILGFVCLVIFLSMLVKIWVPYAMATVNATAITFLPPDWAKSYIAATLPKTAQAHTANKLIIHTDHLHIEAPIVEGVNPDALLKGVGHDPASALPGKQGRFILSGHRFWPDSSPWATVFFSLDKLKVGDMITIVYNDKTYKYRVTEQWNVPAGEAHPQLAPSTQPVLTIYTCGPTPYSSKNRLGFHAVLDESQIRNESDEVLETLHNGFIDSL